MCAYRATPENRAYQAAWKRRRTRLIAYGRWEPLQLVSPEPARAHIAALRRYGLSYESIAAVAGISPSVIAPIVYPDHQDARKGITPRTEAAILAVGYDPAAMPPDRKVACDGSRRRVQALATQGWSAARIAERLGTTRQAVHRSLARTHISARKAAAIAELYDELADQTGPDLREQRAAVRRGWAPPAAWDEDTIDDPEVSAEEYVRDATPKGRQTTDVEDIAWLALECGQTAEAIGMRFGVTADAIGAACRREDRLDVTAAMTANADRTRGRDTTDPGAPRSAA